MAYSLLPWLDQFFTDSSGNPLAGGAVETYAAGTSTPKATFSDPAGSVQNANPIQLGSNGRPVSGGIYGTTTGAYKIVVKDSSGVVQPCSRDNVWFPSDSSGGSAGDYLDKSTTSPQSVAGAVTWAETQSMSKGLSVTGQLDGTGASLKLPSNSWIMPQTANTPLYLTTGADPSLSNSSLHLNGTSAYLSSGDTSGANKNSLLVMAPETVDLSADQGAGAQLQLRRNSAYLYPKNDSNYGFGANLLDGGSASSHMRVADSRMEVASSTPNQHESPRGHEFVGGLGGLTDAVLKSGDAVSAMHILHNATSPTGHNGGVSWSAFDGGNWRLHGFSNDGSVLGKVEFDGSSTALRYYDSATSAYLYQQPTQTTLFHSNASGTSFLQLQHNDTKLSNPQASLTFANGGADFWTLNKPVSSPNGFKAPSAIGGGTAVSLVARDSNNNFVSYPIGSGGYVSLNGHNDMGTTPWSIADDVDFASSDAGIQFDPAGTYQTHLKGNTLIDQGASNVLTLYRQAFSIGTTQDLLFAAQNSLGNGVAYVHQHSYISANTAGAEEGEWRLQTRVAGSMVERIRANAAGGNLTGEWRTTGKFSVGTAGYLETWGGSYDGVLGVGAGGRLSHNGGAMRVVANAVDNGSGWRSLLAGIAPSMYVGYNGGHEFYASTQTTAGGLANFSLAAKFNSDLSTTLYGALTLPASTATLAPLTIPTGVAVTSPATGNIWSAAADQLQWRSGANSRSFAFLETAQTFSGIKTFSATPVISSTTASTTAGAIYKRTNYGHVGYEAGHAQEFLGCIYTGPVGTALTNSTTETDVTGGTALFGSRTLSTTVMQVGTYVKLRAKLSFTNTAANTLTLRIKHGTTVVGTITLNAVNAGAAPVDVWCEGVAQAAPGASVSTVWTCGVEGNTALMVGATSVGAIVNLATNSATVLSMTAQWSSALATSSVQTATNEIIIQ